MSCEHHYVSEHLDAYLDQTLAPALRRRYDADLAACDGCLAVHQAGVELHALASNWQEAAVPRWHRTAFAARPVQRQRQWPAWVALAGSCLTLLLVIFRFELSTDNGLTLSFGGDLARQRLEAQFDAQLAALRADYGEILQAELADFSETQTASNRVLLADWLERSRREQRQDLEFMMSAWESQRFRDRQQTEERLSYLTRNQIESDQYLNELLQSVGYNERGPL